MSTNFVKYCNKEHNIALGAPTIQLGTFKYYRKYFETNPAIGDSDEAKLGLSVDTNEPRTLNQEELDLYSGGTIKGDKVHVSGGGYHYIESEFRNCYIFCSTICEDDTGPSLEEAELFKDANSWYQIHDLQRFVATVGNILTANMTLDRFDENYVAKLGNVPFKSIALQFEYRKVEYVESKTQRIRDGEAIPSKTERENDIGRAIFQKDKEKYEWQREHRIVFYWAHPETGLLPVKEIPILLPTSVFAGVCEAPSS